MNQDFLSTNSEKAILGGSLVVFISLFLPWYGWDVNLGILGSASGSFNGFHSYGWLSFLALLAVVALWSIRRFGGDSVTLPEMGVPDATVYMIGGAVEVLGAVLFWVTATPDVGAFASAGARFGVFIGLVGGALTIFGGYLRQSEPQAAAGAGAGAAGGGGAYTPAQYSPPPPPASAAPPSAPPPPSAAPPAPPPGGYSAPPPPSAPTPPTSPTPPTAPPSGDPPDSSAV